MSFQIFIPADETQVKFFPELMVLEPTFLQDLFNSDVAECAEFKEVNKNIKAVSPAVKFLYRFIH